MRLDLELEVTYFPWLHTRLLSRMRFFLFFFSSPSRRAANLSRAKREEGISPRIIPCRVIWQGTRARNNDPCTVIGFNGAGAKPRGRSWPLTWPIPSDGFEPIYIYIYTRTYIFVCIRFSRERSGDDEGDGTIGHICRERSSFPLDESRYTRSTFHWFEVYSSLFVGGEGGRRPVALCSDESKPVGGGKAAQKRLQSFPFRFGGGFNLIEVACRLNLRKPNFPPLIDSRPIIVRISSFVSEFIETRFDNFFHSFRSVYKIYGRSVQPVVPGEDCLCHSLHSRCET